MARRAGVTSPHVPPPDRGQPAPDHHPPHRVRGGGGAEHRRARDRPAPPARAGRRDLDRLVRRRAGIADPGPAGRPRPRAGGRAPGRRSPLQRSGHPLLRRVLQRGPLAPVSLSARPGAAPGERLGELRRSQSALLRRCRRPVPEGRPGLGARLPAPAPSRPPSSPPSRSQNRILPPHPVPVGGAVPNPAGPGPAAGGDPRRGPGRLSYAGLPAPLRHRTDRHSGPGGGHRPGPAPRPRGAAGRLSDGRGQRVVRHARAGSGGRGRSGSAPRRRERPDARGRGPAGLYEGDSPPSAVLRADAAEPSRAAGEGPAGAGGGAFAHRGRGLPGLSLAGGRAGRPDQRRLRHGAVGAGALHLPRALAPRPCGALPRRGRHGGDAAPRRDESGGQGVRGLPRGRRRGAGAERVRRRRLGAARGGAGESLRHRRHGRRVLPRLEHGARRAPCAAGPAPEPGADLRRAPVGHHVPGAAGGSPRVRRCAPSLPPRARPRSGPS